MSKSNLGIISVIIPAYNAEKYISQCIESVINQSYKNLEIILIDDGSVDQTGIIADSYSKMDNRIRVVHQENSGVSVSRNTALDICTGKYVMFVDADDWLDRDSVKKLYEEAENTQADIVYGIIINEYNNRSVSKKVFPRPFRITDKDSINTLRCAVYNVNHIKTQCGAFPTINSLGGTPFGLLRKRIIDENGIRFVNELSLGEDVLFWQIYYEYVQSVSYIDSPFYHYRINEDSLSHGYKKNAVDLYVRALNTHYNFLTRINANEKLMNAFYLRAVNYIFKMIKYYFQNKANPNSFFHRYSEYKSILKSEPFSTAITICNPECILKKRKRLMISLLKMRLYFLFWSCMKINAK